MKFTAIVDQKGKTATGVRVPDERVASLGQGKRPPVRVTINGYTYRSTVAVMGGVFLLRISADVREKASLAAGDKVEVDIELDTQVRVVPVPADFKKLLDRNAVARRAFEGLSNSRKQQLVLPIEGAKTPETRQRRIDKALAILREG
jgi:antitoxin component of MazEF toxin-antitoxin module